MKRWLMFGGVVCIAALTVGFGSRALWPRRLRSAASSEKPDRSPVGAIYRVAANLYVVPGGGGNTAVFVTATGVVLVDTKYPERYEAMVDQVRTVTNKPITHVINTHAHGDHMGGNQFLPPGVEIIVQENTAKNMEAMRPSWDPENVHGRPMRTYKDRLTLFDGEDAVDLYYFGPAHTDGDTFVVFRSAGVMHTGDVFPRKGAPIINTTWGGNGVTYGETIGKAATTIKGVDRVILGHGPVATWKDFADYGEFTTILLDDSRVAIRSGKHPFQLVRELKLPSKFVDYDLARVSNTLDEIYRGLTPWWQIW